jgi:hypothetical protein
MVIFPALHSPVSRWLAGAVLLLTAASLPAGAADASPLVGIDVRSSVDERWSGVHKLGPIAHGKVYGIASISETPSADKLARPVDVARLARQLRTELSARGFVEIAAGQKPDVVLTVHYGRGFLRNPYTDGMMLAETSEGVQTATITMPDQVFRQLEAGFESKLQAAQTEKLFIRVTAWKFPEAAGEKPAQLWQTTMLVDDPANRDLNELSKEMLAAGADYFDRTMKREQVTVIPAERKGQVKLGPLEIIETVPKGK